MREKNLIILLRKTNLQSFLNDDILFITIMRNSKNKYKIMYQK